MGFGIVNKPKERKHTMSHINKKRQLWQAIRRGEAIRFLELNGGYCFAGKNVGRTRHESIQCSEIYIHPATLRKLKLDGKVELVLSTDGGMGAKLLNADPAIYQI
jgi:hypothetical protein